ncbi:MAG: alpha/beta fold hydrolase [Acidimicrobiales bacterium]|jgi:pimeloyl-ACP methyl ester carboxylesterase
MSTLTRDGVSLFYEVTGSDTGDPPLLLTHGYAASCRMWESNVPALSAARQVIIWDQRGHGRSASPPDEKAYSEAEFVEDMAAIIGQAGAPDAVIGGLSIGGYLSLAFHLAYPEKVAALILCDTGPGYKKAEPREDWNRMAIRRAEAFEEHGLQALGPATEVAGAGHRDAGGLAKAARGVLVQHDARVIESLPSISVPTLVVVGSKDAPFLAAADYLEAKIPGARKVVLEGAGHAANIDRADEFNHAVIEFLEAL